MRKTAYLSVRQMAAAVALFLSQPALADAVELEGNFKQGGMIIGHTEPGARVTLDGKPLRVTDQGLFVFGFDRDAQPEARLEVTLPSGCFQSRNLGVEPRLYDIQRIDGLPDEMVTPPPEALARIEQEAARIDDARRGDSDAIWFSKGFIWPAKGRVSGVYGSQRILNGIAKRPHFGLDVAAPVGTPVVAPAAGTVTLAEPDLYYTGGTVMIDHGLGITSILMHMYSVDVKIGQQVAQGARIGAVGATGRASGPHVDWRVNWFKLYLDPQLLIKGLPDEGQSK